jgi:hypothetical protein
MNSTNCPLCRLPYKERPAPPSIQSLLSHLHIRCCNSSLGCEEILPYDLLEKHVNVECKYISKKCLRCRQMVSAKDIDQHQNLCKSILVKCPNCQAFIKFELIDEHEDECFQERLGRLLRSEDFISSTHEILHLIESKNQSFQLAPRPATTQRNNLHRSEIFNQSRQQNYFNRLWAMFKLILFNPLIAPLIIANLYICGSNIVKHVYMNFRYCVGIWIRHSVIQVLLFVGIFDKLLGYGFHFLFASVTDKFIIFSLIICGSIHLQSQLHYLQLNVNLEEVVGAIIGISLDCLCNKRLLLMLRYYFESLSSFVITFS